VTGREKIMEEWEIKKPLGQCSGTGTAIEPGQEYFAALIETPEGLERRDFSETFWQEHKPDVYCYWKSKLPLGEQKKKLFIDDDMLMAFFERLAGEQEQEKINFRFVLTLLLMRKRLLKYDSSLTRNSQEIWRLRVTGSGDREPVEVINPHLTEEQIEGLSNQVGQILQIEM
jgi:hypothetical protein